MNVLDGVGPGDQQVFVAAFKAQPAKILEVRFWTCRLVPIAPSKTTMRSFRVSRKLVIAGK